MNKSNGPIIVFGLVLLLIIIHQDIWFWESGYLVFGFIPVGLFYHALISIAASCTWFLATKIAWPAELEMDEEGEAK